MTKKDPTVRSQCSKVELLTGYIENLDDLPKEAKKLNLTSKISVIIDTYSPESVDMEIDTDLILQICYFLGKDACAEITYNKKTYNLIEFESIYHQKSDLLDKIKFFNGDEVLYLGVTINWYLCGGPDPYHDSLTVHFYSSPTHIGHLKNQILEILRKNNCQITHRQGLASCKISKTKRIKNFLSRLI